MRIGEFVSLLNTTKDTVRHYEDLGLITPTRVQNKKYYGEKDKIDFKVIQECKHFGLTLSDIQALFQLKSAYTCGDERFIKEVLEQLSMQVMVLKHEEALIKKRRMCLENELMNIKEQLKS
ncbi:MerR family transcriptional regulator [Priestia koreensis]|uniref:MerR family transcriptional regulator n=1 Tax=Priestia koreensis TaxID=284581 RepID=UPI001F599039|nr:MerR family transcriptional regulator [Priestia koreensis]MCM3004248.1 MerR family transcriptional regulator [Priestia koreensis]UNL83462.1 MerR family transcriptional regulator [Priestia koreensis]